MPNCLFNCFFLKTQYSTSTAIYSPKEDHTRKMLEHILILENVHMNAHNSLATIGLFAGLISQSSKVININKRELS